MSVSRPRAGSTTQSFSHGLGISVPSVSPQTQAHRDSYFGQGQAHNDGRGSIVALRRQTTFGRPAGTVLGQLKEDDAGADVDESRLDAEEVLRGLSVGEVRRVEARLRSLALSKQQELRSMVGERYRDLLSSSAALGTLFDSSSRLSDGLGRMRAVVGGVSNGEVGGSGGSANGASSDNGIGEELALLLPLASQTKLLLDSPELIYRFLESSLFLPASYLFSLCRLVHSEVSEREEEDEVGRVGALVEGQWETLQGLRGVISDRARLSLRDVGLSSATHTQTLIALVQLDSLSLASALQLLLTLRFKLLGSLLPTFSPSSLAAKSVHIRHPSKENHTRSGSTSRARSRPGSRSTSRAPSRTGSRAPSRGHSRAPSRDESPTRKPAPQVQPPPPPPQEDLSPKRPVKEVVKEAVGIIVGTLRLSREIFGPAPSAGEGSTLELLIKAIEAGERAAPAQDAGEAADQVGALASAADGSKSDSQRRRDSRLASLSMPFSFPSATSSTLRPLAVDPSSSALVPSSEPLISTRGLIKTLPSSPLLLRYLPQPILEYTPFLLSSSATPPSLPTLLATWLRDALALLTTALEGLVGQLNTVKDVWSLRAEIADLLSSLEGVEDAEKAEVSAVLSAAWDGRVRVIWERQLGNLQSTLHDSVRLRLASLDQKEGEGDVHPPSYTFAPSIPFPTLNSSLPPSASLPTFRTALRKRVLGRTPLIEAVVRELEGLAEGLRDDVGVLRGVEALEREFEASARTALDGVVRVLKAELEQANGLAEDDGVRKELFLGRIAAHLCVSKSFESDTLVFAGPSAAASSSKDTTSPFVAHLIDVHSLSLTRWRERAIGSAVQELERVWAGDARVRQMELEYSFKPSRTDAAIFIPASVPSPPVLCALHSLVGQLQSLGLPPSMPLDAQGLDLYSAFAARVQGLDGWTHDGTSAKERVARSGDVLFLSKLVGEGGDGQDWGTLVDQVLASAASDSNGTTSSALLAALSPAVLHGLQRTQTLLLPLLSLPLPPTPAQHDKQAGPQKTTWLLPFAAPPAAQGGGEVVSALGVAAPSPRFGLLAVGR